MIQVVNSIDGQILLWIQNMIRNPVLDKFMIFYTGLGDHGLLFISLALLLMIIPATRKTGYISALGLAIGSLITLDLLKPFIMRPRPYLTVPGLTALVDISYDPNSFPSGHTTAAFGVFMGIFLFAKDVPIRAVSLFAAVLMGFSRLYVGVHNPTDVIAGALIGTLGACLAALIINFIESRIAISRQLRKEKQ